MKKITLLIMFLVVLLSSCKKKQYTYIQLEVYENSFGEQIVKIDSTYIPLESNDTLAYKFAYKNYAIAYGIKKKYPTYKKDTLSFMLIAPDGRDITDIEFPTKDSLIKEIEKDVEELNSINK